MLCCLMWLSDCNIKFVRLARLEHVWNLVEHCIRHAAPERDKLKARRLPTATLLACGYYIDSELWPFL